MGRVLSEERLHRARALGLALRLGSDLSGRSATLLKASELSLTKKAVVLSARRDHADMLLGEQTRKRLSTLATHLDLAAEVEDGAAG
jgi:exopolyphosphatase/guanosine-5'-triphosphate,3'-diphosphate pyrophosphatase